jgi:hypothetical protein
MPAYRSGRQSRKDAEKSASVVRLRHYPKSTGFGMAIASQPEILCSNGVLFRYSGKYRNFIDKITDI